MLSRELTAVVAMAVAFAVFIVPGQWAMRRDTGDLCERMLRLDGSFEGFTLSQGGTLAP